MCLRNGTVIIVMNKEFKLRGYDLFHRLCILCTLCVKITCVGIITEKSHASEVLGAAQF